MSAMTFFYQECPTCGRSLRIPVKYFGRQMACTHCEGEFRAGKEDLPAASPHFEAMPTAPESLLTPAPQLGQA